MTEVQTPNSVSGTGYLLDPNNEYTVTIEPGATKTLDVVNYEPSGQITLTKETVKPELHRVPQRCRAQYISYPHPLILSGQMVKSYIRQDR